MSSITQNIKNEAKNILESVTKIVFLENIYDLSVDLGQVFRHDFLSFCINIFKFIPIPPSI